MKKGVIAGIVLDESYTPDEIDEVNVTPNAVIMAYSFYGRLYLDNKRRRLLYHEKTLKR